MNSESIIQYASRDPHNMDDPQVIETIPLSNLLQEPPSISLITTEGTTDLGRRQRYRKLLGIDAL